MNKLKKIPLPLSGLSLGILGLGNILPNDILKYLCGFVGFILILTLILKILIFPKLIKEDLKNPILAAVFGTFPMALMVLSTYIPEGFYLWSAALIIHIALIIYYSIKFLPNFNLKTQYASIFIVYIGIGMATITGFNYNPTIGYFLLIFSAVSAVILVPIFTFRYKKYDVNNPFKPLICIFSAPASLIIVAYLQSTIYPSKAILMILFIFSLILFIFSLAKVIQYRNLDFYPSYSAYTFPFVITANASLSLVAYFPWIMPLAVFEIIIAVCLVLYVLIAYINNVFPFKR